MRELERVREELLSYLDNLITDRQTDRQTLIVPKVTIVTEKINNEVNNVNS